MLNALFRGIAALSLRSVHGLGGLLGRLVYCLSATYRRRLVSNLAQAGYSDSQLSRAAAAEAGKQALETPWVWLRPRADITACTHFADPAVFEAAMADGRPVMFLPPHLGSFEVTAQYYSARPEAKARPMTVLYRIPRKSVLRDVVAKGRAAEGLRLAPAEMKGVRMCIRTCCDIRLRRTCCSRAVTCARFRNSSVTRTSPRRRSIPDSTGSIWPRPTTPRTRAQSAAADR